AAIPLEPRFRVGQPEEGYEVAARAVAPRAYPVGVNVVRGGVGPQVADGALYVLYLRGPSILRREPVVDRDDEVALRGQRRHPGDAQRFIPARPTSPMHVHHRRRR